MTLLRVDLSLKQQRFWRGDVADYVVVDVAVA